MKRLKIEFRPYKCDVCGRVKDIQTNHTMGCLDLCRACSNEGAETGPAFAIPALGEGNYREFTYCGEE